MMDIRAHPISLADRPEAAILALEEGLYELTRHQLHVMPEGKELTAQMMGADAGLHADHASQFKAMKDLAFIQETTSTGMPTCAQTPTCSE
jgi:hypothetical protein